MCVATLWLTAADSVQDLHLIPFSLQPKLQHQWILLQSYNKWAEKQQAFLIVFPECSHNLSKVTTNERKNNKLAWLFFPNAAVTYLKLQQMRQKRKRKPRFSFPVTRLCASKTLQKSSAIQKISVNLYKEYTSLRSRELEELLRFQVMSWQPS